MHKQRFDVGVIGFSDVERHALNTLFRLSETRDAVHAPWAPLTAPGAQAVRSAAQVMLVDGESAEAVLAHARELPAGQRLIWVGADAPPHAWRVLERPIVWSGVLHALDAVCAARQADFGQLDLDLDAGSPAPLQGAHAPWPLLPRALLVGVDEADEAVLRAGLALAGVTAFDLAHTTDAALGLMERHGHRCAVFNLDDHQVEAWALARLFRSRCAQTMSFALSENAGPQRAWWVRRRVHRDAERAGVSALLARPLQAQAFTPWLDLL